MLLSVNIKKQMGDFTLEVAFQAGVETIALLGSSGSGKSMTLKCIAGIETPDEGRITVDDKVLFDSEKGINLPPRERKIGYLFQQYALFPNMTVEENIGIGVRLPVDQKHQLVKEKIQSFYLEGLEKKKPHQLSGGQQQRVALARIIASSPEIIMFDEPFSALDSYLRWQLERDLIELLETIKIPVLYVSHNRDEVYRVSDRIGVINQGRLEVMKEKNDLFHNPETLCAALLTGCKNYSSIIRLDEHRVVAKDWNVELHTQYSISDQINYIGIRAHHIRVIPHQELEGASNCLECMVVKIIENTFSMVGILQNTTSKFMGNRGQIRMEIDKNQWNWLVGDLLCIQFQEKDLILLL